MLWDLTLMIPTCLRWFLILYQFMFQTSFWWRQSYFTKSFIIFKINWNGGNVIQQIYSKETVDRDLVDTSSKLSSHKDTIVGSMRWSLQYAWSNTVVLVADCLIVKWGRQKQVKLFCLSFLQCFLEHFICKY